jgi:ribosomal protein L11 methyltransferase
LTLKCNVAEKEKLLAEFYSAGTTGVIEEDAPAGGCTLSAFFDDHAAAVALLSSLPGHKGLVEVADNQDWIEKAHAAWKPVLAGKRFFLAPPWCDDPAPESRIRMSMPPGTASGTGMHVSTQIMLAALEHHLRPDDRVFDLGTGSGILSAASAFLGAGAVVASDIDEASVLAARAYTASRVALFLGSARALRSSSVDLVVANINAVTLAVLAADIARVLRPGGRALLGGFVTEDLPRLCPALAEASLATLDRLDLEGWVCLITAPRV